ncbi:MAG: hypothetical protein K1W16_14735 [Lachnospiraceae bacterium]
MEVEQKKKIPIGFGIGVVLAVVLLSAGVYGMLHFSAPKGYKDYTVQKEQYYVEYSEQYDYWDVLTVEYPSVSRINKEYEETLNKLFYDMAMEKVNFWHLFPDDEVKELQKDYQMFCSDVHCEVPYHSQYLMSVHFQELYAPISPLQYVHRTQRCANVNLMTGEQYVLSDIFTLNDDFIGLWCTQVEKSGDYGDLIINDADTRETFLQWFLNQDEEANMQYLFIPFFYLDKNKDFVIGLSYDPKPSKIASKLPLENSFCAHISSAELEPYRTDSEFWNWYEQSEQTGEILECEDLKENLWLGKDASIWEFIEQ